MKRTRYDCFFGTETETPAVSNVMVIICFAPNSKVWVLSWKKGTRRAGWVARGSELGARRTGWVGGMQMLGARGTELAGPTQSAGPQQRAPAQHKDALGPHTERPSRGPTQHSPGLDRRSAGPRHRDCRGPTWRALAPDKETRGPTQRLFAEDCQAPMQTPTNSVGPRRRERRAKSAGGPTQRAPHPPNTERVGAGERADQMGGTRIKHRSAGRMGGKLFADWIRGTLMARDTDTESNAGARHKERQAPSADTGSAGARATCVPGFWWCVVGSPLMPPSLRFGPSAHVLGICKGCGHVVYCCFIFRATLCIKGIETEASQKITTQLSHPCPNKCRQFSVLEAAYFDRELYLSLS